MEGQLESITRSLVGLIEKAKTQFEISKASSREGDFFLDVKPFADLVKDTLDDWIMLAKKWIQLERPSIINEKQLEITYDHIEKISIQSFYPKTSRKLFLSSLQSAQFVLQSILQYCENQPEKNKGLE